MQTQSQEQSRFRKTRNGHHTNFLASIEHTIGMPYLLSNSSSASKVSYLRSGKDLLVKNHKQLVQKQEEKLEDVNADSIVNLKSVKDDLQERSRHIIVEDIKLDQDNQKEKVSPI